MRSAILTVLAIIAAGPAAASSIETMSTIPLSNSASVTVIQCAACPQTHQPLRQPGYTVPTLANGDQRFEIRERGGKPALMRTEAWMGGSPVTFVSLNPVFIDGEQNTIAKSNGATPKGDGVDLQATTSAVANEPAVVPASAPPAGTGASAPDFSSFELRPGH